MKLCICDLDGVIANNEARFAKAEEAKQAYITNREMFDLSISEQKEATNLYWQTAFTPELVALDVLIDGAREAIYHLEYERDYKVIYLTSRPESMRQRTEEWLAANGWLGPKLIHKAPAFQYTKTTVWKAGMVQTLASLYGADEVVVIEDEQANIDAITDNDAPAYTRNFVLTCFKSLEEAYKGLSH